MKIGIMKPGKKIYFYENTEDHAAWSQEIIDIIRLFEKHGHDVKILSETDNPDYGYDDTFLDKVYVFNGVWQDDEEQVIKQMKERLLFEDAFFICSDMRLMTTHPELYNKIFTQSKRLYTYGAIQEHQLMNLTEAQSQIEEKTIPYYFGGTERGRSKDFMEYIFQPGCIWSGKSETLKLNAYIPHHIHINNLKKTKTTIVIADETYNEIGFVNDRYYECAKYDVICFMDSKVDPDELIMSKDDWRRVHSYSELKAKQQELNENEDLYHDVLNRQRSCLYAKADCHLIYEALI